ncbi:helix-turn-helix transcriptional regulator [Natrarchaeobaculum sulfurireducens]|uniref:Transcriptional regulator, contains HTH domain n=1 Tax=Natrarchaeobaculum sulfurireducens TaxID=2044521 RepID=A0A346PBW9_9EURY|nr:ArsR family transcriptional regulator [Natrarchaeobaculum sulfurireducens]AXR77014.1 Transcriptional regulator, contains HTH domain [Natrarchaeobaculum sulfurireducens]
MESALEEIEFLALSSNRVEVLELLAAERYTRAELARETGASQATLGRILGDFGDRSWIVREGSEYTATATGKLVAAGFTDLLEIVDAERKLRNIVSYLPVDALTFDVRRLAHATITTPSRTRPNAPLQRLLELLGDADSVRTVSHAFNEQTLTVVEERTAANDQSFTGVFSRPAIDALADEPDLRRRLETLLEAEEATVGVVAEVPLAVMTVDDVVYLLLRDEQGILRASVDTADPDVRAWADTVIDDYLADATLLEVDAIDSD